MYEGEEPGEAHYTLRFAAADVAEYVGRELRAKGYEVQVSAAPDETSWEVHVRWQGSRSARVARSEPDWMRRVATRNGGILEGN
jgi:hypothetical protein